MKRYFLIASACAVAITLLVLYRHSIISPKRPSSVPVASVPCRFGFSLCWVELTGFPASEPAINVFDAQGKFLNRQRVLLAKAPLIPKLTSNRGYEPYTAEAEAIFVLPNEVVLSGSGLGTTNNLVVRIDRDHSLAPYWWFK